jgi:transcription elongation factor Elf1
MSFTEEDAQQLKELRDSFQQYRQNRVTNLLKGPYICPKCHKDLFFCQTSSKRIDEKLNNIYNFVCKYKPCNFRYTEKTTGKDSVIDAYNRLIDREE